MTAIGDIGSVFYEVASDQRGKALRLLTVAPPPPPPPHPCVIHRRAQQVIKRCQPDALRIHHE